ncbi:MAG: hypothetical protein M0R75_16325 [Dehalococcoidia bacterium]|nr:hypothetical protein [Dehalococcoidia bacterium]
MNRTGLLLTLVACAALVAACAEAGAGTTADEERSWAPQTLTGSGPSSTVGFYVGASTWEACFKMLSWDTLSDGSDIGVLYATVRDEDGQSRVASLAGDAERAATREGCTVVRSDPGRYYFDINTGPNMRWQVTASP